jgi:D-alanine--poly(phosphoribitol) ligase subunit 2
MNLDRAAVITAIKNEIIRIAETLDCDASDLQPDELIPATGLIDSAGLLDLVAWFERQYQLRIAPEDFNVDNLGTMDAMADFMLQRKGAR